jgi:hypothetical protein
MQETRSPSQLRGGTGPTRRVVRTLEYGNVPLEESLVQWERGEALAAHCQSTAGRRPQAPRCPPRPTCPRRTDMTITPEIAWAELAAGNERFATGTRDPPPR